MLLKSTAAAMACAVSSLALATPAFAAPAPAASAPAAPASPRQTLSLADGWKFQFGAQSDAVTTSGFDDSKWASVSVPHTWNRVGEYHTARTQASNNDQGVGWYRLNFQAPAATKGQHQYLDFAAVGAIAEVWVNGARVGEHRGAFSRFRFDVSAEWKPGAANLIVVKADNSKPKPGSSTADVLPLLGDFFVHGGIYRAVSLITTDSAGIDLLDHAGPGVYARATGGAVSVLTRLRNSGASARKLTATATIADASGTIVASASAPALLKAGATGELAQTLTLNTPHLWNGRADPYLYSVRVELRDGKRLIDAVTQPLGVRSFKFDPNEGFSLNGHYLQLHGVSRHQDRAGKGWALARADHKEDMDLIAEMGANTVRMAHYQHDDAWADEADSHGMVAWAEVPYVSAAAFDGTAGSAALWANAESQAVELIRQNYNHPSIMMWSVGNEVDASALFLHNGTTPKSLPLLQFINAVAKREDPSRPTTFADCCEESLLGPAGKEPLAGIADLIGYNRYFGWYYPEPLQMRAQLGAALDHLHAKHPALPLSISEYGAGGALSQHSDNPEGGAIASFGRPHPEEYQSFVHEENWAALKTRKYLFATWVWNMFDFASDLREEGDAIDINDKGLVTYDRKTRKDAFYFYQANWTQAPMIHVTGKRYVTRAYPYLDVRAYSTAERASLTLNGKALGEVPCPDHICVWKDVALAPGKSTVVAAIAAGGQTITDSAEWIGPDPAAGVHIDAGDLTGHVGARGTRYGSDNFFNGGSAQVLNTKVFRGMPGAAPRTVSGDDEPALYDGFRTGAFTYSIPVPPGTWTVTVHSFEPDAAKAASRSFSLSANGKPVLRGYNPAKAAGGALKPAITRFALAAAGGRIVLDFGGDAVLAAIDVTH